MISIITPFGPTHEKYLEEAYKSLQLQSYQDFEWVLVPNNGAVVPGALTIDRRIRVYEYCPGQSFSPHPPIGDLKSFACSKSGGDIIVEFDADDMLLPSALARVREAFEDPLVQFVYSNDAYFTDNTWEPFKFGARWGWQFSDFEINGHKLAVNLNFPLSAHSLRYIFFSPDHLRAWRTSGYWKIGGHNKEIVAGDDHDLMCRFYIEFGSTGFHGISDVLYLYRRHGNNGSVVFNKEVQDQNQRNYCNHSRKMIARWASEAGLPMLDFGSRFGKPEGYLSVDKFPPADYVCDLDQDFPWADSSIGVIRASHIVEHLKDPVHTMNECYRVLAPGGWLLIEVPSTDGRGAFQDPTHVSFWNENSFWYYTDKDYARYIQPGYTGRFQSARVVTWYPNNFFKKHEIPVVQADLICLKPPYDLHAPGGMLI